MQQWQIIILSTISLILSIYLFHKSASTLSIMKMNIVSLVFYSVLVLSFVGSVLIGLGIDQHYMSKHLHHYETRIAGWAIVQLVLILMPLSMIIIGKLFKYRSDEYFTYLDKKTQMIYSEEDKKIFIICSILSFICIISIGYTFYSIGLENNPIINMILGAPSQKLARLRIMANREFPGNQYIRNILALGLTPFLSYLTYIYARLTKKKRWIILFSVLFISSLLITFYDLQKAPILRYLLTFIILSIYFGDKLKFKQIAIYGLLTGTMIISLYIFVGGASFDSIFSLTSGPLNRIFLSQSMPLFLHVEVFTYKLPFLNGASFPSIISEGLLGLTYERSGRTVMAAVNPGGVENGVAGVANGLFTAEAYGNFGWIGIIISIIYVAVFIYLIHIFFVRRDKNPVSVALFAYVTSIFANTIHGGFVDFIYNPMFIILIVISIGIVKSAGLLERIWFKT